MALDTGPDKLKKICDLLRKETLEPAKGEAAALVQEGEAHAEKIVEAAKKEAEKIIRDAHAKVEKEKRVFEGFMKQGAQMAVEALRQALEKEFFKKGLQPLLEKGMSSEEVAKKLTAAVCAALEKEGTEGDVEIYLPKQLSQKDVVHAVGSEMHAQLKKGSIELGDFSGGIRVELKGEDLTLDLSEKTLRELLARYVRKDFRALFFGE